MIIRDIIFSTNPPATPYVLWVKAGANNINTLHVYDGGWRKIGTSSGEGGTSDYTDLENKPKINNVVLDGNLSLEDLGIIIPNLENYVTKEALNTALSDYAKKTDIPSVEGLLSEIKAQELYQPKGDYALKTEVPTKVSDLTNDAGFQTAEDITSATKNLATKTELSDKQDTLVSGTNIKTINGNPILGEGNIEIQGGSTVTVDDTLNTESVNPVQNKVITEKINAMNELLAQLDEKVFPTTLSVSGGGTYDEGTSQTVMVSWKLQKNGQTLIPDSVTVNEESVDPAAGYKVFVDVTTTTTYRVSVVYKGKTYSGSTTATFKKTYYRYHGALPENTEVGSITADMVKGLTKEVCTGAAAVLLYTTENQRMAYAYPSVFGKLTTIKDTNFNAPFDDFLLESTLDVDGTEYYVYALTTPNFVTDYSVTFVK